MLKKRVLQAAAVVTPFLCAIFVLMITGHGVDFSILVPAWNDETGWFSQVAAMVEYGHPLGYYGYNGTHAAVGTFGPWGIAPLIPYWLFGSVFGWHVWSMALANISFLCLAVGIFILLTKPSCRQLGWIIGMYCCLNITVGYSMTAMSEGLHYSLGIVLLAILLYLPRCLRSCKEEGWRKKQYILVIVLAFVMFYAVNVYLVFALAIPAFCWIVCSHTRRFCKFRIPISVGVTLLLSFAANYLIGLVTAPYTTSTLANMINTFREEGLYRGMYFAADTLFHNLQTVNLFLQEKNGEVLAWFFTKYVAVTAFLIWQMIAPERTSGRNRMSWKQIRYYAVSLYILLGFLVGYCLLYTGSGWTLCRGINTGFTIFLFYLCSCKEHKIKKIVILLSLVSVMSTYGYYSSLTAERQMTAESLEHLEEDRERIAEVVQISPEKDRWENTIACYGDSPASVAIPAGAGLNAMMNGGVELRARYAFVSQKVRGRYLEMLLQNGHSVIYENDSFLILWNNVDGGDNDEG